VIVVESRLAGVISDISCGTLGFVVVLVVATTVMTNLVTNTAIVTPVALRIAADVGVDPRDRPRPGRHLRLLHAHQPL
jgi:di/tricarboxylate transporter